MGDQHETRRPTSHERRSGQAWDASYHDGAPPWDIGRPQPAVAELAREHDLTGPVLDAGCGTGENALHLASRGLQALGVDVAETAIKEARRKAAERGIDAAFQVADALELGELGREFPTVLDCALFHTFDDDERPAYADSLASVTARPGTLYLLCFSDRQPGDWGPRRVTQDELRATFTRGHGWDVRSITPTRLETILDTSDVQAWLATIDRV